MWGDDDLVCLGDNSDSFFPQRNQPPAPVPGSIGVPMPVPRHLQERLLVPEEDEDDIEAERETQKLTTCRNDGFRCRKEQLESASQSTQPISLSTQPDSTSLGTKSGLTSLGTRSGPPRSHQFEKGLERCDSNH